MELRVSTSGIPEQALGGLASKRVVRPHMEACTTLGLEANGELHAIGAASVQTTSVALIEKQEMALFVLPGIPCAAIRKSCEFSSTKTVALGSSRLMSR